MRKDHPPAGELASVLLGESECYFDPVWRVEVTLSGLERELLVHPAIRRLGNIAHAGAASFMSVQVYSRLEHSLGLLALVSQLRPDDSVMRVAALVHDIGHLPLSHTLERTLGVNHHDLGEVILRGLEPMMGRYGVDVNDVIASVNGQGSSPLGINNGLMKLDHLESYVRSAHVHGTTWETPRETLASIELVGGNVSCSTETATYLFALMTGEAERQTHWHNIRANAVTAWLVQRARGGAHPKTVDEISRMIDRELWAWLESVPETSEATRILLRNPEQWSIRAVDTATLNPRVIDYEIRRLYADPPRVDGRPSVWPTDDFTTIEKLPRHFAIGIPSGLPH